MADDKPSYNRDAMVAALLGEELWPPFHKLDSGVKDHMHALGVIITNYNALEVSLFLFFYYYINDAATDVPRIIFTRLNNQQRVDVVGRYLEALEKEAPVSERVKAFLTGYNVC